MLQMSRYTFKERISVNEAMDFRPLNFVCMLIKSSNK